MTTTQIVLTVVGVGLVGLGLWIGWLFIKYWYVPRSQAKPEPDEKADAENAPISFRDPVVTGHWDYGDQDDWIPEGHGYYFPDDGIIKIYYRHWEWGQPITEKEQKPATDEADANAIFEAFMQEKSMAIIDDEFRDHDYLQGHLGFDDDGPQTLTFESGDVFGYWIPFPWDWDQGRVYFFRDVEGHVKLDRITKYGETLHPSHSTKTFPSTNTNQDFCTRDNAKQFFLDHWGEHLELRNDLHYEYDGTFKVVRIFQVPEPPSLDHKLVAYEPAGSEAEAKAVFEKFRSENRNPILPRVEPDL